MLTFIDYLGFTSLLYFIGMAGILLNRKNFLVILVFLEVMFVAAVLNYVLFSSISNDVTGEVISFLLIVVAGAESAIGLSIITLFYRSRGTISIFSASKLKG